MADSTLPPQLAIINGQLKEIFGEKYTSIFMNVKPSQLLVSFWIELLKDLLIIVALFEYSQFDGIPLCVNPSGITGIICSVIKSQKPQAIHEMSDGSMKFSLFGHVSHLIWTILIFWNKALRKLFAKKHTSFIMNWILNWFRCFPIQNYVHYDWNHIKIQLFFFFFAIDWRNAVTRKITPTMAFSKCTRVWMI